MCYIGCTIYPYSGMVLFVTLHLCKLLYLFFESVILRLVYEIHVLIIFFRSNIFLPMSFIIFLCVCVLLAFIFRPLPLPLSLQGSLSRRVQQVRLERARGFQRRGGAGDEGCHQYRLYSLINKIEVRHIDGWLQPILTLWWRRFSFASSFIIRNTGLTRSAGRGARTRPAQYFVASSVPFFIVSALATVTLMPCGVIEEAEVNRNRHLPRKFA